MPNTQARFRVTGALLRSALGLPDDVLFIGSDALVGDVVEFTVHSPRLPDLGEGVGPRLILMGDVQ